MSATPSGPATPQVAFPVLHLPKLEMCFHDGSRLWLQQATNDPLKRLIEHDGQALQIDLRRLVPSLEKELYEVCAGDRPGVIFFCVRQAFKSADSFVAAVTAVQSHQSEGAHA